MTDYPWVAQRAALPLLPVDELLDRAQRSEKAVAVNVRAVSKMLFDGACSCGAHFDVQWCDGPRRVRRVCACR